MKPDEFQKEYHEYITKDGNEAREEAKRVNDIGIEGDEAVAICFGDFGWGLMLRSAAEYALKLGIIPEQVL